MKRLLEHAQRYPAWQAQDVLKLLYQRYLGCGHFAPSEDAAHVRMMQEWEEVTADASLPLVEALGDGYVRIHLAAAKAAGISPETLVKLFLASAHMPTAAARETLLQAVHHLNINSLGVDPQEWEALLRDWESAGMPAVSHSEAYRAAYHPAYRVVESRFAHWLLPMDWIYKQMQQKPCMTLAIDGRSGSGKSCFAACLTDAFGASVAHMDDFFLPADRKTPERLARPGGNVDIERFRQEVLQPLSEGQDVSYHPFSCRTGMLSSEAIAFPKAPLMVVEGSYSLHPAGNFAYDGAIFLSVAPEVQRERIRKRNGDAMLQRFEQEWIPLEEKYFRALHIPEKADICYDSEICQLLAPSQV